MDAEEFCERMIYVLGALGEGKLITIIPCDGTLDWREYDLESRSLKALLSWPDVERARVYSELIVSRAAYVEAHGPEG